MSGRKPHGGRIVWQVTILHTGGTHVETVPIPNDCGMQRKGRCGETEICHIALNGAR